MVKKLTLSVVLSLSLAFSATGIAFAENSSLNKNSVDSSKGERIHQKHFKEHGQKEKWKDLQSFLGVDSATLKKELKSGKSLAEIAQAKGISATDLAAKMQASAEARIEQALKDGKLTPEKADKIKANLKTRIEKAINYKHDPNNPKGECTHKQKRKNLEQRTQEPGQQNVSESKTT